MLDGCLCLLIAASCGPATDGPRANPNRDGNHPVSTTSCSGFALSLASDRGGQATPLAAAQFFVAHRQRAFAMPGSGWNVSARDGNGVSIRSGSSTLHTVQGTDRTWQVDSGKTC